MKKNLKRTRDKLWKAVITLKSILIGSVGSSKLALETMIEMGFPVSLVFSLDERYSGRVSGYEPIHDIAKKGKIPYKTFRNINDANCISAIREIDPDYIFVIGLSQLVGKEIIHSARKGVVGYHPAPLPKFRGRAAIPWQIILGTERSKVSLFKIDEGMDSGPVIGQREYLIARSDYAEDVLDKSRQALKQLLLDYLPKLVQNGVEPKEQDHSQATYLLKRSINDGRINWNKTLKSIHTLIRATSRPYPGAFSLYEGKIKTVFWRADVLQNCTYVGTAGQIANVATGFFDVVGMDGLLRVSEWSTDAVVRFEVGDRFV